ncbi:MAG: hypothetical protein PF636_12115 [Actinomycetota bacterium]|jgi:hypothetical protein|nr:hypothetical protein [Actinomycetota bacterium]
MRRFAAIYVVLALAVLSAGGVWDPSPAVADKPPPSGTYAITVDTIAVDFGMLDPEIDVVLPAAVTVTVAGFKIGDTYDLSYTATDFTCSDPTVTTPVMPIDDMRYAVSGDAVVPETAMGAAGFIDTQDTVKNNWNYDYVFDFTLNVPFDYDAGIYTADVVYTAVLY